MPRIEIITSIKAPIELCFDLARDIDLHVKSAVGTHETAIAGVTTGLINLGEQVTWEAQHFRCRMQLTATITAFDRPRHFRDSQVRGIFRRFDHDHFFSSENGVTIMRDLFDYESPLGLMGRCADRLFLKAYMTRFLSTRAEVIRQAAER